MNTIESLIDTLHHEDLHNRRHPSVFDENETYDMLIIRLPVVMNIHELDVTSFGFIITEEASYFFNALTQKLEILSKRFDGPYRIIDEKLDNVLRAFQAYEDEISTLEESLYSDKKQQNFMDGWLKLKRDIVRIERVMLKATAVLNDMVIHYESSENFPLNHYADLHEHCERLHRSAALQLAKLDYLFNFYTTRTTEKMNRLIFLLTIISAVFLPLNLVVGFFGMNTSGLPLTEGPDGTSSVVSGMLLILFVILSGMIIWRNKIDYTKK
ncbi:CorA family divalent cation transporter [Sulfurovum mangrovi]|uniref:CorA family divalent cation transporter n=1 Tax=Sulfurovum mangrovi TaxID=2893889 RepID=UPI001E566370|nr:CorA family divalent cation transporter [Sulfurovum mangrovi]UFH60349.1 magnesium transporter [Sulfurovum mangrovi]